MSRQCERCLWGVALVAAAIGVGCLRTENQRLSAYLRPVEIQRELSTDERQQQQELLAPFAARHRREGLIGVSAREFEGLLALADDVVKTPTFERYLFENPAYVREGATRNMTITVYVRQNGCRELFDVEYAVYVP